MPRAISARLRKSIEEPNTDELLITFMVISHESLKKPIRVNNDTVDYIYQGERYYGFPFEFEILTDSEGQPRGTLRIQNVSRRIGDAILELSTPPSVELFIIASEDFLEAAKVGDKLVRVEKSSSTIVEYRAEHLTLGDVGVDAMQVQSSIESFNLTNEPWPAIRTTEDRLPGLEP